MSREFHLLYLVSPLFFSNYAIPLELLFNRRGCIICYQHDVFLEIDKKKRRNSDSTNLLSWSCW